MKFFYSQLIVFAVLKVESRARRVVLSLSLKSTKQWAKTSENDISVEQLKGEPLISVIEWKVSIKRLK